MKKTASVIYTILFAVLVVALVLSGLVVLAGVLLLYGLAMLAYTPLRWLAKWGPVYRRLFAWRMRRADRVCRASGLCAVCQLAETQASARRPR